MTCPRLLHVLDLRAKLSGDGYSHYRNVNGEPGVSTCQLFDLDAVQAWENEMAALQLGRRGAARRQSAAASSGAFDAKPPTPDSMETTTFDVGRATPPLRRVQAGRGKPPSITVPESLVNNTRDAAETLLKNCNIYTFASIGAGTSRRCPSSSAMVRRVRLILGARTLREPSAKTSTSRDGIPWVQPSRRREGIKRLPDRV